MKKRVLTLTALIALALAFSLSACGSINEGVPTTASDSNAPMTASDSNAPMTASDSNAPMTASDSNASTTQEAVSTEDKTTTEQVASTENEVDIGKPDLLYEYPYSIENGILYFRTDELNIPNDILETISTEDLLDQLLYYPDLTTTLYNEEDPERSVTLSHLKEKFNGINEFLSRADAYDVTVKKYSGYQIPKKYFADYPPYEDSQEYIDKVNEMLKDEESIKLIKMDGVVMNSVDLLEIIMLELSTDEETLENTKSVILKKETEKADSAFYSNGHKTYVANYLDKTN